MNKINQMAFENKQTKTSKAVIGLIGSEFDFTGAITSNNINQKILVCKVSELRRAGK